MNHEMQLVSVWKLYGNYKTTKLDVLLVKPDRGRSLRHAQSYFKQTIVSKRENCANSLAFKYHQYYDKNKRCLDL